MSNRSSTSSESAFDVQELAEIRARCRELRNEMLKDSQSQSLELIKTLELHVKTLSESRTEDKKRIKELERELKNCLQEIDYLQDQLNSRNTEVNYLGEHICDLQLKLAEMENVEEDMPMLREELARSTSERVFLMQALEKKDIELNSSSVCIEKLDESISSVGLEYQCEIESLKLDLMALEQQCFEAKKSQEETAEENATMSELIQDLEFRMQDAEKVIKCLDKENKDLRKRLEISETNAKVFCGKVEESLHELLNKDDQSSSELEKHKSSCGDVLGPLLSKLAGLGVPDAHLNNHAEKMSSQIHEYELLISQLKEELREEKLKAKDEAEDLAQEMAELRYHMTELLEEECKRRACVEQLSLQRIAELETQLKIKRSKSSNQEQIKLLTGVEQIDEA